MKYDTPDFLLRVNIDEADTVEKGAAERDKELGESWRRRGKDLVANGLDARHSLYEVEAMQLQVDKKRARHRQPEKSFIRVYTMLE